jgi:hypothetical protein
MKVTENTTTDHIIETPYIGYRNISGLDYTKTIASCGICAICMILSSRQIPIDIKKMVEDGHQDGGYTKNGWLHSYLIKKLEENGLFYTKFENCSIEKSIKQIAESILAGNPVIVSVNKFCLEQTSFHMILLTGIKSNFDKSISGFFYHDPAAVTSENGSYRYVAIENFIQFWRKMMIIKI